MPSGVPIVAAADGTVRLARGDSTVGGCDPAFAADANYVVIAHENGLETQYLHLESVVVKPGDPVKSGDVLGYSGKTGWACGSHLHFKVARVDGSGWNNPSVPARIRGYGDPTAETWIVSRACAQPPAVASDAPVPNPSKASVDSATSAPEVDQAGSTSSSGSSAIVTAGSPLHEPAVQPSNRAAKTDGVRAPHAVPANAHPVAGTGATE